jgi:glutamate-1-semialdehyde aminotransferase
MANDLMGFPHITWFTSLEWPNGTKLRIGFEIKGPRDLRETASYLRGSALGEYMRYHGVYASDLHISFVSAVHTEDDVDRIVRAYKASLRDMRAEGIL